MYPNGNPSPGDEKAYAAGFDENGDGRGSGTMSKDELRTLGHEGHLLKAVRRNCIECQRGNQTEVRGQATVHRRRTACRAPLLIMHRSRPLAASGSWGRSWSKGH
jgi:hypothetical protein